MMPDCLVGEVDKVLVAVAMVVRFVLIPVGVFPRLAGDPCPPADRFTTVRCLIATNPWPDSRIPCIRSGGDIVVYEVIFSMRGEGGEISPLRLTCEIGRAHV